MGAEVMARGELEGRTAIVSGGGRGIGRAAGEALAGAGARVVLTSRTAEQGEAAAAAVQAEGGEAVYVQADQASSDDWARVTDTTLARFGRLDILVLAAGVNEPWGDIADQPVAGFDAVNAVNLRGVFLGLKHGVEAIRRGGEGGSVVLVGSIVGLVGAAGFGAYTASKDGVRLLAKAAALELGPEKIRVNSLHPGMTDTELARKLPREALEPLIPLKRYALPGEIANAILFLASDRSRFMTGAELVADGGWTVQ